MPWAQTHLVGIEHCAAGADAIAAWFITGAGVAAGLVADSFLLVHRAAVLHRPARSLTRAGFCALGVSALVCIFNFLSITFVPQP